MRYPFLMLTAVVLALSAPLAPLRAQTEDPAGTAPAEAVAPSLPAISVSMVGARVLRDRVIASGLVGPVEEVRVAPLIEGQPIEALLADVGDYVEAGQVLAVLSRTTLDLQKSQLAASLASARATIAQAEASQIEAQSSADEAVRVSERTRTLRQQGASSQAAADQAQAAATSANARVAVAVQSLEAARANLSLVEAQIANIDLQLSRTEVKAPVAGRITSRNAQLGGIASGAAAPMFEMIRDGALELRADVPERDIVRLQIGQTAQMTTVAGTAPLTGTIRLVEPVIDAASRLGRARIEIDDESSVRSGMFVDAEILVVEREAIAVPVTAVGSSSGGTTVMKVTDGQVSRVAVRTGIRDGGWVEILDGLADGDSVVTKAGSFVRDGDRINPVPSATN